MREKGKMIGESRRKDEQERSVKICIEDSRIRIVDSNRFRQ